MTPPGSAGTAADGFRVDPPTGRHRAPPPVPAPRAPTVIAAAAAVLIAASLVAIALTPPPDARASDATARSQVSTVTRAERTDAGPLVLPTVGASGAWEPSEETRPAVRPVTVTGTPIRVQTPASTFQAATETLATVESPSEQTVTPTTPEVTTAPPAEIAAATTTSSATTTEEPAVTTPTETTVTVDVAAEVTP